MPIIDKVNLERTRFGYERRSDGDGVSVRFVGRAIDGAWCSPWPLLSSTARTTTPRQVHSASVRSVPPLAAATPADALVTRQPQTALLVVTADCVPLLAFDGTTAIAVHAGWRGIASGVVRRSLDHLDRDRRWRVWLGPHIGPCCYEVSREVAEKVARASHGDGVVTAAGEKPHLDLGSAALAQVGLQERDQVTILQQCTRCSPQELYSYRRQGPGAGSNLAVIGVGARP